MYFKMIPSIILISLLVNFARTSEFYTGNDPNFGKSFEEIATGFGYPVESHKVETSDGYILTLHRIPHGKQGTNGTTKRTAVFLQHGIVCTSEVFVLNWENNSLGFQMADAGYDVWLGNFRGNTYSRAHKILSPRNELFWNFSIDETASRDLPAMIDYTLKRTGQKDILYTSNSMGVTSVLMLLSESPEFNKKIKGVAAVGPVAKMFHSKMGVFKLTPIKNHISPLFSLTGMKGFVFPNNWIIKFTAKLSGFRFVRNTVVLWVLNFFGSPENDERYFLARQPVYLSHLPGGSSEHTFLQFVQFHEHDRFDKYDFGAAKNKLIYNQPTPPEYNVSRIETPFCMIYSPADMLTAPEDLEFLMKGMTSIKRVHSMNESDYTHMDMIVGRVAQTVNNHIINFFRDFS